MPSLRDLQKPMMLLCRDNAIPSGLKMKFILRGQGNIMPSVFTVAYDAALPA
jgi:hypothetical protein